MIRLIAPLALIAFGMPAAAQIAATAAAAQIAAAVAADPPADAKHPADMAAFVLPSHGSGMNAVLYTAAGAGPHPTLLLLHGFPGNEQNLDLAQAARRAGWNVLTLHYRGSWGSQGVFSFANAAEDAVAALAWLRRSENTSRYAIDPARIAVAGHSMGGVLGAGAAARDAKVLGAFLIDPADMAGYGRAMKASPEFKAAMVKELRSDLPPLAGTDEATLIAELESAPAVIDLAKQLPALAGRPLVLAYAARGVGATDRAPMEALARKAGAIRLQVASWPTDHGFSDHRVALADLLVRWLDGLNR